jgi:hypothetical protein
MMLQTSYHKYECNITMCNRLPKFSWLYNIFKHSSVSTIPSPRINKGNKTPSACSVTLYSSGFHNWLLLHARSPISSRRPSNVPLVGKNTSNYTSREIQTQTKLDQPSWKNGHHQTSETRPQLQTTRETRLWMPQDKMATRRCRNRSNDLIHGERRRRWW